MGIAGETKSTEAEIRDFWKDACQAALVGGQLSSIATQTATNVTVSFIEKFYPDRVGTAIWKKTKDIT